MHALSASADERAARRARNIVRGAALLSGIVGGSWAMALAKAAGQPVGRATLRGTSAGMAYGAASSIITLGMQRALEMHHSTSARETAACAAGAGALITCVAGIATGVPPRMLPGAMLYPTLVNGCLAYGLSLTADSGRQKESRAAKT